jgi:hypothetical protein
MLRFTTGAGLLALTIASIGCGGSSNSVAGGGGGESGSGGTVVTGGSGGSSGHGGKSGGSSAGSAGSGGGIDLLGGGASGGKSGGSSAGGSSAGGGSGATDGSSAGGGSGATGGSSAGNVCGETDGKVDQKGCSCATPGASQKCFVGDAKTAGVGVCSFGMQTCTQEKSGDVTKQSWGPCTGYGVASKEVCDGKDNDCNGVIDDGCQCTMGQTDTAGCASACPANGGSRSCTADGQWGACSCAMPIQTQCTPGQVDMMGCAGVCPNGGGQRTCDSTGNWGDCGCACANTVCSTVCGAGMQTCDASGNLSACQVPMTTQPCTCPDGSTGSMSCQDDQQGACQCAQQSKGESCAQCIEQQCSWDAVSAYSQQLGNDTSQCMDAYNQFIQCVMNNPGAVYYNGPCDQPIGGCDGECGCGNIIRTAADCASTMSSCPSTCQ